jgi:hypothetical protein
VGGEKERHQLFFDPGAEGVYRLQAEMKGDERQDAETPRKTRRNPANDCRLKSVLFVALQLRSRTSYARDSRHTYSSSARGVPPGCFEGRDSIWFIAFGFPGDNMGLGRLQVHRKSKDS